MKFKVYDTAKCQQSNCTDHLICKFVYTHPQITRSEKKREEIATLKRDFGKMI